MKNTSELYFNGYESTNYTSIAVDPSKVKEVLEWKPPATVSEV
jgi:hypothetical protein